MRQRKRSGRKMISALLAFILLLSMLPAPLLAEEPGQLPDIQEAAVITGFEAITVDAGSAGSAGYADSEAVIAYLEANHAQVQAITAPDSSTVNIAVTGWTAPSGDGAYNPAVAGSYTFTATLGQLPEVYANPNNLTATAEVVVAAAEPELEPLADGIYSIEVRGWHATDDAPSMLTSMLDQEAKLEVSDGEITATIRFIKTTIYGTAVNGQSVLEIWPEPAATPTAGTGITGTYNSGDESKTFTFALSTLDMPRLDLNVGPPMNSLQTVRLKFDMESLTPVSEVDITGFEPIADLDGGTVVAPVYADTEAVRAALPTAVTIAGTSDTVPVTAWADTDAYDPNTAGSYTFTAALGDIPTGYANPDNLTAAAEVVVAASSGGGGQVYAIPLALHNGNKVYGTTTVDSTSKRVMFNDYAMVTAKTDGSYRVKLQFYSYSLVDAIQVVDPAQVPGAMQEYPKFSDLKMGTYNLTGVALQEALDKGYALAEFDSYYLQGPDVLIEQRDDEKQMEIGYISFDVPNLEQPVLMKTYHSSGPSSTVLNHQVGYFDAANGILLPDSPEEGNRSFQFVWTNVYSSTLPAHQSSDSDDFDTRAETVRNQAHAIASLTPLVENVTVEMDGDGTMEVTASLHQPTGEYDYYALAVRQPVGRDLFSGVKYGRDKLAHLYGTTYTTLAIEDNQFSYTSGTAYEDWAFGKQFKITSTSLIREAAGGLRTISDGFLHLIPGDLIPDGEITAFDPITVDAGNAFSATYADAAAVITHLNDHHGSVTAQTSGVGAVTVPVTGWADTDCYDPDVVGRYTFTASLGELPAGCTLGEGVTATAEAVVGKAVPTGVTVSPASATVQKGKTRQFTAVATGQHNPSQDVAWSVIGAMSAGTAINENGLLSVAADETAAALTVRATAAGTEVSGAAAVTVAEPEGDNPLADNGLKLVPGSAGVPENAVLSAPDYKNGDDMTYFTGRILDGYVAFALNEEHYKAYSVSCTVNGEKIEPQNAALEFSVPDGWDLSQVFLVVRNASIGIDQTTSFTINEAKRIISVSIGSTRSINSDFVFVHEAAAINPHSQIQEEGVYKARIVLKHARLLDQSSMANNFIDHDAYIEYKDGAYKLYVGFPDSMMENMYLYNGNRDNPPVQAECLEYAANADGSLYDAPEYTTSYYLTFPKRLSMDLNAPDPDMGDTYWIRVDVPAMDSLAGTAGDHSASADARLLILAAEKVSGNPLAGYDKTVIRFQLERANRLLAILTDDTQRASLQSAIDTAQTVYDGAPGSGETKAARNALTEAIEAVQGEEPVRLEAPAISSAYDEQNNSYTVTISTETADAIKYRLSGSESGTGEWLDYTGPFVVDSANEQISQGLLYVSAYAASIETGTQDSEVSSALLDFREEVDPDNIQDGEYTLPVRLWHASDNAPSMGNNALEQTAHLVVEDGQGTLYLTFKSLTFMGMEGYLSQLNLLGNIEFNENNYPVNYTLIPATVISTYDVVDQFNHPDSTDPTCAGKPYPKDLSVPVVLGQEYTWVHVYVPVMGSMGFGDQVARIKLDWNGLAEAGEESIEITAFDPVTIDAGTTASPAYADAAAVIAHLGTNYANVTANTEGDGTVAVPVAGWTDTDTYNPSAAGSYTFTAVLGDIPEGYANPNNLTATAEVVVADPLAGPVSIPDANLYNAICEQLGQDPATYTVTVGDMENLTSLDASDWGITNLTGLSAAVNLEVLDLSGNPLTRTMTGIAGFNTLTKLKHLDLSNCQLGEGFSKSASSFQPEALMRALTYMPDLEHFDLSNNKLRSSLSFYNTNYGSLKTVDVSSNYLHDVTLTGTYPALESFDLSDNSFYVDEYSTSFSSMVAVGIEKFKFDNMKNLAVLQAVWVDVPWTSAVLPTSSDQFVIADGSYTVDIGSISGSEITFACVSYAAAATTKVTVDGEKYTVANPSGVGGLGAEGIPITLTGLGEGAHTVDLAVMHMGGDTRNYTLKFNVAPFVSDDPESAGVADASLRYVVVTKLGGGRNPRTHDVTKTEMASLTGTLSPYGADNLEGIQYATQLNYLNADAGKFKTVPDLSGLTALTSLRLNSSQCEAAPEGLASLTNLTTLDLSLGKTENLPDLSGLTKLKSLSLTMNNMENLPDLSGMALETLSIGSAMLRTLPKINPGTLKTLTITASPLVESLPENIGACTQLGTLTMYKPSITDFSATAQLPDNSLALAVYNANDKQLSGFSENKALKKLTVNASPGVTFADVLVAPANLSELVFASNSATDLPAWIADCAALTTVSLSGNQFTDIPEELAALAGLNSLDLQNNHINTIKTDLTGLSGLTTLNLRGNAISEFSDKLGGLPAIQSLNLAHNSLPRIGGALNSLTTLTSLQLDYNLLFEAPDIKNLINLKTLQLAGNFIADIPEDYFGSITTLTSVRIGNSLKLIDSKTPTPGTGAAAAFASLRANSAPNLSVSLTGNALARLRSLDSDHGPVNVAIQSGLTGIMNLEITATESAKSITLTPVASHSDSVIKVGDETMGSGQSITISGLVRGENNIDITITITNPFYNIIETGRYLLKVTVGDSADLGDFPQEGRTYSIKYSIFKRDTAMLSMADEFFTHSATVSYKNNRYTVDFTTNKGSYIPTMQYYDESHNLLDAVEVARDEQTDHKTFRLYVNALDKPIVLKPYVVPMGSAPECRMELDLTKIFDITDTMPSVDKADLAAVIANAETELAKAIYTDAGLSALQTALDSAKAVNTDTDATQEAVAAAMDALTNAINGLVVDQSKLADKTALESALDEAKAIQQGNHSATAWNTLQDAITEAQEVCDRLEATQEEVAAAVVTLTAAITRFNSEVPGEPLDPDNLPDGEYTIPVRLWHSVNNAASMGDNALEQSTKLVVEDGAATLHLNFKPLEFMGLTGYLSQLDLLSNIEFNENNYPVNYDLLPATVLSTYDVVDQFNHPDSTDPNCAGKPYPKEVTVPVTPGQEYTWVHVYVPVMGSMGFGDQVARIKLDWSNLTEMVEPDPDETGELTVAISGDGSVTLNSTTVISTDYTGSLAQGDTVTLKATANSGSTFLYWQDAATNSVLTTSAAYTTVMGSGIKVTAVFAEAIPDQYTVIFKDKTGTILSAQTVAAGQAAEAPAGPSLIGYNFSGWDKNFSAVTSDLIVTAVYARQADTYAVTVEGGTIAGNSAALGAYQFNTKVIVEAAEAEEGLKFAYWEQDGRKINLESTYVFYMPKKDIVVSAVYVPNDSEVDRSPFITMVDVQADTSNNSILFMARRNVTEGYSLVESGILLVKGTDYSGELTVDSANVIRGKVSNSTTDQFAIRKTKVVAGDSWYGRAYMILKAAGGQIVTVYGSDTDSGTL